MSLLSAPRANMIENQIRAGGVLSGAVFDAFDAVLREDFVPEPYKKYAFADMEIPLGAGQKMFFPLVEAKILEALSPGRTDMALEIGAGSGFMAALIAYGAKEVVAAEIEPELRALADRNLAKAGVSNVRIHPGDGFRLERYAREIRFDVILLSGSVPQLPQTLLEHLAPGGRLAYFRGNETFAEAFLAVREKDGTVTERKLFETAAKPLRMTGIKAGFAF